MFSQFRKGRPVSLEEQLAQLADLGIAVATDLAEDDYFAFATRDELEQEPFTELVMTLSMEIERDPWTPKADRLWNCDFECIEGDGSYVQIVERLERMTDGALGLQAITDRVSQDGDGHDEAWVEFTREGERVRWEFEVQSDWLDPSVLTLYAELLANSPSDLCVFVGEREGEEGGGQNALFVCLRSEDARRFRALTGIRLAVKRQGRLASAIVLKQLPGNPVARRSTAIARRYTRNR